MYLSYGCLVKLFWFSVLLLCFLVNIMVNKDEYISKTLLKCLPYSAHSFSVTPVQTLLKSIKTWPELQSNLDYPILWTPANL